MYKKGYLSWLQYYSLQKQTGLLVIIEFTVMIEFLLCPFGPIFPFYCINSLKNQVWKNEKNAWLYWCTPTTSWYDWCTVPEIKNATDMSLFHFMPFYAFHPSPPLLTIRKVKTLSKKNYMEISLFHNCLPKVLLMWSTVPEI